MTIINTLAGVSPAELYDAHRAAFAGYARSWTATELERMLARRGYVPEQSFGAFSGDGRLVSFTMNGIGRFQDLLTAYDISTGTLEGFRGQGLASAVFKRMAGALAAAGIRQYLLEVLQDNTTAVELYQRQGFRIRRELAYFIQDGVAGGMAPAPAAHVVEAMPMPTAAMAAHLWDFAPAWQNSPESMGRVPDHFEALGVFAAGALAGYGIIEPDTGDIPQIAVAQGFRRRGIGSALLHALLQRSRTAGTRIINVDAGCTSLPGFLERQGIPRGGMQYEMVKAL